MKNNIKGFKVKQYIYSTFGQPFDQNSVSRLLVIRMTGCVWSGRPERVRNKKKLSCARGKVASLGHPTSWTEQIVYSRYRNPLGVIGHKQRQKESEKVWKLEV